MDPIEFIAGEKVVVEGKDGKHYRATVRIKAVNCGKENCKKCPHKFYAYAQYRAGEKITEKYLGTARGYR